jgi:hypothetical protein
MFWSALRRWGEQAVASGILTIADIKNGAAEACTVLPGAIPPAPVPGEPQKPASASVGPAPRPGETIVEYDGVVRLLDGDRLIEVTAETATIVTPK